MTGASADVDLEALSRDDLVELTKHGGRQQRKRALDQIAKLDADAAPPAKRHKAHPFNCVFALDQVYRWCWGLLAASSVQKAGHKVHEDQVLFSVLLLIFL